MKRNRSLKSRGQLLVFSVAACLLVALLGVAFFQICMLIGGSKEFRNAVDAGTLAVARYALLSPNIPVDDPSSPFLRIANDTYGSINVKNVNMVIGKAWLVRANEFDMEQRGYSTGFQANGSALNARLLNEQAAGLVGELVIELSDVYGNFNSVFRAIASSNPLRMFAVGCATGPSPVEWKAAYLYAKSASNMWIATNTTTSEIPKSCQAQLLTVSKSIRGKTYKYMQGYVSDNLKAQYDLGPPIPFITLEPTIKPHLLSSAQFNECVKPPADLDASSASYIVPNGFSNLGLVTVPLTGQKMQFQSCGALGEINTGFPLAIPDGVIRIENHSSMPFQQSECVANQKVFELIAQRALQITPEFSSEKIISMLSSTVPVNKVCYIFSPPKNNPTAGPTQQQQTTQPDGKPWPQIVCALNPKQQMQCIESTGAAGILFVVRVTDAP